MGDYLLDKRCELLNLQIVTYGKLTSCSEDIRKSALLHNLLVKVQSEQSEYQVAHLKAHEVMRKSNIVVK